MNFTSILSLLFFSVGMFDVHAWQTSFAGIALSRRTDYCSSTMWTMRDRSASMAFGVGDQVKVMEDISYQNKNLRDNVGVVVETWEKCQVDPTCCCAEQVDENMAVRVEFRQEDGNVFTHYFGENELTTVKSNEVFDGMTCTAYKLDKLERNAKPRSIASFDPQRPVQE